MKRRTIFRAFVAASVLGVTAMASGPAMAGLGDGQSQSNEKITMIVVEPQFDQKTGNEGTKGTTIEVDGRVWHREDGEAGVDSSLTKNEGVFSEETVAEIHNLVTSPDFAIEQKLPEDLGFVIFNKAFEVTVGEVVVSYMHFGKGDPEGDSSFVKLVRLLEEKTAVHQ